MDCLIVLHYGFLPTELCDCPGQAIAGAGDLAELAKTPQACLPVYFIMSNLRHFSYYARKMAHPMFELAADTLFRRE
jgi:hypothetical protein